MINDFELGEPIDESLTVWRYMDFASFYSLLLSKSLFFRRLDKYTDEHEGALPDEAIRPHYLIWDDIFGKETSRRMVEKFRKNLIQFNTGTLSCSWVLTENEIYAMWKIYLKGSSEGVAIKSKVGRLKKSLSKNNIDFSIAKVSYEPFPWEKTWYKTLPAYKISAYSYETELRVLAFDQFNEESVPVEVLPKIPLYENGTCFDVGIEILIEQIYVSPFAEKWFDSVIRSTVKTFLPSFQEENILTSKIKDR